MYYHRQRVGPVELAFTDRRGGVSPAPFDELNLALDGDDPEENRAENHRLLLDDFAPGDELLDLRQVHGATVDVVEEGRYDDRPDADAVVTASPGLTLMVRAADCVPVLLADPEQRVVGAVHCGRLGLVAGVVPAAVARLRDLGARHLTAHVGPHICGHCYEVSEKLRLEVGEVVPAALATTSWGTPSLDLGAGVRSQLDAGGVDVSEVAGCTLESQQLYSYRRDGDRAGRHAGLIRIGA